MDQETINLIISIVSIFMSSTSLIISLHFKSDCMIHADSDIIRK
jgi:hypothetical protein